MVDAVWHPCLYVTHPEVVVDPAVPVPQWSLSARGRTRTEAFARAIAGSSLRRVVASHERKAIQTAEIIADGLGLEVELRDQMHENDRSATGFLPPEDFEAMADRFFAEPLHSAKGWERAVDAQSRIVAAVRTALAERPATPTLFVGHGAVGTLLLCALGDMPVSRIHDQAAGGGSWFAFHGDTLSLLTTRWQPMESAPVDLLRGRAT